MIYFILIQETQNSPQQNDFYAKKLVVRPRYLSHRIQSYIAVESWVISFFVFSIPQAIQLFQLRDKSFGISFLQ